MLPEAGFCFEGVGRFSDSCERIRIPQAEFVAFVVENIDLFCDITSSSILPAHGSPAEH